MKRKVFKFNQCPARGSQSLDTSNQSSEFRNSESIASNAKRFNEIEYRPPSPEITTFLERELILLFDDARLAKAERVLEYLARAESRELDVWAQDDIRVAWQTVLYAARGYEKPWELAFSCYYGKHPSKAIPIWLERWAERDRKLGPGLTEETAILPPRKPVQSVKPAKEKAS